MRIKFISKPGSDYNLFRCQKYLTNQAASSIKAFQLATGWSDTEIMSYFNRAGVKLNDNQKAMVRMYRGDNFDFGNDEPYDFPFDIKKEQNQIDLINAILRSE